MSQPTGHAVDVSIYHAASLPSLLLDPVGVRYLVVHVTRGCAARPRALILNTFGVMKSIKIHEES